MASAESKDPIQRDGLRELYWERVSLTNMAPREWEALCDGCGRCCLNKLEDPDTGEVALTKVACRLFDDETCRCGKYDDRKALVPECITLTPSTIQKHAYWLPDTCAYKLIWQGKALPDWHPLITGTHLSVFASDVSIRGLTVSEAAIDEDDWEDHIIEEIR